MYSRLTIYQGVYAYIKHYLDLLASRIGPNFNVRLNMKPLPASDPMAADTSAGAASVEFPFILNLTEQDLRNALQVDGNMGGAGMMMGNGMGGIGGMNANSNINV